MKRYSVIVTRDITESTTVEVEAENGDEAEIAAFETVLNSEDVKWEVDDGSCGNSAPYVTNVEEA